MIGVHSVKELINILYKSRDLMAEMFEKRKLFAYKYEDALSVFDEDTIEVAEGAITKKLQGTNKATLYITDENQLVEYVRNHFGIPDIARYIEGLSATNLTRGKAIVLSSDSKWRSVRTFEGFPVNSYESIEASLNGRAFTINPVPGTFIFINDYANFLLPADITVVGIENPENFRYIEKQRKYFQHIKPLFVSRYPQSKDLIKWLSGIGNPYLHFGDFDLAGIKIYLNEYKKYLSERASFFVPNNIGALVQRFGNRTLYDKQHGWGFATDQLNEEKIVALIEIIHHYKKVLEQEVLITQLEIDH